MGRDQFVSDDSAAATVAVADDSAAVTVAQAPEAPASAAPSAGPWYRVVGQRAVYGVAPGDVGRIVLTSDQRYALIAGGHIEPAAAPASDEN